MREPAGIVWTEFVHRTAALRPDEGHRRAVLIAVMVGLEAEMPEAIAFERQLWAEAPLSQETVP